MDIGYGHWGGNRDIMNCVVCSVWDSAKSALWCQFLSVSFEVVPFTDFVNSFIIHGLCQTLFPGASRVGGRGMGPGGTACSLGPSSCHSQ